MMKPARHAMFLGLILVAGAFARAADSADPAEDPRQWLADMNEAFNSLSYDGVFSFFSG